MAAKEPACAVGTGAAPVESELAALLVGEAPEEPDPDELDESPVGASVSVANSVEAGTTVLCCNQYLTNEIDSKFLTSRQRFQTCRQE